MHIQWFITLLPLQEFVAVEICIFFNFRNVFNYSVFIYNTTGNQME